MDYKLPERYEKFIDRYPEIAKRYKALGDEVHNFGPLDSKTRGLIKVAISGAAKMEGAFHSHVRKALSQGITRKELEHVILLMLPTLGFPQTAMLLSWMDDIIVKK